MHLMILAAMGVVFATSLTHSAEIPIVPKASPAMSRPADITPACLEWTDNCRICRRAAKSWPAQILESLVSPANGAAPRPSEAGDLDNRRSTKDSPGDKEELPNDS
jgi:hypothetical protein